MVIFDSIPETLRQPATVRQVHRWVSRRMPGASHELRVMHLASGLFRLLRPLHGLERSHRRLLKIGALLHDIGRKDGATRHHVRGAKIIMRESSLELHPEARQFAAYAARHHRGPIPDYADDMRYLHQRQHKQMRILLAIIRAADALDKRGRQRPKITLRRNGRDIVVEIKAADGTTLKGLGKRRKFRMLKQELDARVRVVMD